MIRKFMICETCGVVFVHIDHRLGKCPLGHDQPDSDERELRGD